MRTITIIMLAGMVLSIPAIGLSQPDTLWTSSFHGAGYPLQVIRTTDGGFAVGTYGISGRYERIPNVELQAVKLDSLGNLEWRRFLVDRDTTDRPRGGQGWMIAQVYDGGFVIGGSLGSRFALARVSADGDSLWLRSYPRDEFYYALRSGECCIAPDSNIVATSQNNVVKLSVENGDIIWRFVSDHRFNVIEPVGNDGFLAAGYTGFWNNPYAARIDADGELIWEREYEVEAGETIFGMTPSSTGGWCFACTHRYGDGANDIYAKLMRIDEDGEVIWQHVYEELGRDKRITDILETPDGGFVATGESGYYFYALRTDYAGEVLWHVEYGGWRWGPNGETVQGYAYSILPMEHGGYVLGGFTGIGCWLVCTEADPVDIPFELEAGADSLDFGEVELNWFGRGFGELAAANVGRRYVVIDTLWLAGDAVFTCLWEPPFRIEPEDTAFVPLMFHPLDDTAYAATLFFRYGDEQTLEVALSGRGQEPNWVDSEHMHSIKAFEFTSLYPNPFNTRATICYALPSASEVKLEVYDICGRRVENLFDGVAAAGRHTADWEAEDMPAGLYICRLSAGGQERSIKLLLVK